MAAKVPDYLKSYYATFKKRDVELRSYTKQLIRQFHMNADVINAQVSGEGDNATIAITTVNGETFIYKWNGQLLRR